MYNSFNIIIPLGIITIKSTNCIPSFSNFWPCAFFMILETIFTAVKIVSIPCRRPKAENLRNSEYNSLTKFRY